MTKYCCKESMLISELLADSENFLTPCGGKGKCHKCAVKVYGEVELPTETEKQYFSEEELNMGYRLACMTYAFGRIEVELPDHGNKNIIVPHKVSDTFAGHFSLSSVFKEDGYHYGIAVDLGTTTIISALVDLKNGKIIDEISCENSQTKYSSDVISRLERYLNDDKNKLSETGRNDINGLLDNLCMKNGIENEDIDFAVISGNTVMMYLLCDKSPESISKAPFIPDSYFGEFTNPSSVGLNLSDKCKIYLTRCISSFVGGDITAGLLGLSASDRISERENKTKLFIDIGTNSEIVLIHENRILCASAPAGPVFEGVGIGAGMKASNGAIYRVEMSDGNIKSYIIGDEIASGICGSGIIDIVAIMLEKNIIDETGAFTFTEDINKYCIPDTDVYISQKDIRQIQLAKAAVCAGILSLINKMGIKTCDIEELVISGTFGNSINISSAKRIGMIPKDINSEIHYMGNTSLMGSVIMLCNSSYIKIAEQTAQTSEMLELSTDAFFSENFIKCMYF